MFLDVLAMARILFGDVDCLSERMALCRCSHTGLTIVLQLSSQSLKEQRQVTEKKALFEVYMIIIVVLISMFFLFGICRMEESSVIPTLCSLPRVILVNFYHTLDSFFVYFAII